MSKGSEFTKKARKHIEDAIESAKEEHKRQLKAHRIDLARNGLKFYKERKFGEAVKAFHSYIRILEDMKGVGEGQLRPSQFDPKKEGPEVMLISGVYWDLAKLYDRTRSEGRFKECRHYLEKFVLFSKGMPFEALSTETLRKYVVHDKPMHHAAFKQAYKTLSGNNCYIATALFEELKEDTIPSLRSYRDNVMLKSFWGRSFVRFYYLTSKPLVPVVENLPRFIRSWLGRLLDRAARRLLD